MLEETAQLQSQPQVSLEPPVEEQPQYSIAPVGAPPPADPTKSAQAVVKAKYGMPSFTATHEEMFTEMQSGREDQLRVQAASLADFQTSLRKQQFLNEMAKDNTRPFSPLEAKTIKDFLSVKATDPSSVFEEFYSRTYMENLRKAAESDPDSYLNELRIHNPKAFEKGIETGTDLRAKKAWMDTLTEKVNSQSGGLVSHAYNWIKYVIPFYNEFNLRGVTGDYQSLLGTNLDRVATDLYHLPFDEFKAKTEKIVSNLSTGIAGGNPLLAGTFLQHMTDPSVQSTIVDNVFSAIDFSAFATKPGLLLARRVSMRAAEVAAKDAIAGMAKAEDVAKTFTPGDFSASMAARQLSNKTRSALLGMAEDRRQVSVDSFMDGLVGKIEEGSKNEWLYRSQALLEKISPKVDLSNGSTMSVRSFMQDTLKKVEASAAEAAGNIRQAASLESTRQLVNKLTPGATPGTASVEGLQSAFNEALVGIRQNTRGASQELVNRVFENILTTKNRLVETVENSVKVERIPAVLAVQKNVDKVIADSRKDYPGFKNMFLDSKIRYDNVDVVHYLDHYIGASADKLFSTENQAKAVISKFQLPKGTLVEKIVGEDKTVTKTAIWRNKDTDLKVEVLSEDPSKAPDGRMYQKVKYDGKESYVPADELIKAASSTIEPQGSGFKIKVTTPLRENSMVTRDGLLELEGARTPDSWLNAWGGYLGSLRTPEETLSAEQLLNRKISAYGPSQLLQLAKDTASDIKKLRGWSLPGTANRAKWKQWESAMDELRYAKDPVTGERGWGFKTIGDIQDFYQNTFHRIADEQEIAASFSFKNQGMIMQELKNLRVRTEKLRLGAETHDFFVGNVATETDKRLTYNKITVDGIKLRELPKDGESVLIIGGKEGQERVVNTLQMRSKADLKILEDIKEGRRTAVQLTNQEERPFAGLNKTSGTSPLYVVDNGQARTQTRPLQWDQISRRNLPDYDYDHYVAQPILRTDIVSGLTHYLGDRHIMAHNLRAIADDVAEKLDAIRKFLKAEDMDGAKNYHSTSGLPQTFSEIQNWFKADVTTEGLPIPARLSLDHQIRRVAYNNNVLDLDKSLERQYGTSFRDKTKEQFQRFLADERDPDHLWTLDNSGTKANPDYKVTPVQTLDPVTSMNRAMNRVINDAYLNDYKLFSVEHWIQEAKEFLAIDDNRLASAPTYFFYNPTWKAEAPVDKVNNLMTAQLQIKQFLGIQDKTTTFLHAAAQQLADATYEKFGPKFALVPTWALPQLRDPFAYVRSLTFDATLGLFALPQLFVQLQTFTNIAGIAGFSMAAPGARAMLLHQWSRFSHDPAILDHLDKLATGQIIPGTERFRPGWFKEAHTMLTNTGFELVGKEHARLDNPFGHNIIGSAAGDILNFGRVAFTEGEKATRIGAWYTAYLEFRSKNPTGAISNVQVREILDRADLLTSNMSRASASSLNSGVMSIPTQFLTYTLRTAELFTGKRLTGVERARLFGFNAAMYGLPTAFGLSGLPFGQTIRQWAQEDGYVVGDNFINSMVTEGGLSTLLHQLSGYHYNVGERFGPQGFEDALRSDKAWWEILGGAAGSKLVNTIASMDGFTNAMLSAIRDDNKAYKMTADDFVKPFKEISSVNNLLKTITALNTAKWVTKKGDYISDVTQGNAIFMFLSGLSPQDQADMFTKSQTRKEEKEAQTVALSKFVTEFRRFLDTHSTNPEQANQYFKNAFAILRIYGYPEERVPAAISIATKDYESMIGRSNWDYYLKDVPTHRKDQALEAFKKLPKGN